MSSKTDETTVNLQHASLMLRKLGKDLPDMLNLSVAGLRFWFSGERGDSAKALLIAAMKSLYAEDQHVEITSIVDEAWSSVNASSEAAQELLRICKEHGYSAAAVKAVAEQKNQEEAAAALADVASVLYSRLGKKVIGVRGKLHAHKDGCWSPVDEHAAIALAVQCLPHKAQSVDRAKQVVELLAYLTPMPADRRLYGLCRWGDESKTSILINCEDCVVRVTADRLERTEHSPDYYFSRKLAAKFDPQAKCKLFEDAVDLSLPPETDKDGNLMQEDQEMLRWMCGYILYPANIHKVSFCCLGPSHTRKTTIVEDGIAGMFHDGDGSITSVPIETICKVDGRGMLAVLDAEWNLMGELSTLKVEDSSRWKSVTSGDRIYARTLWKEPEWRTGYTTKFVALSNHPPQFKKGDDAEFNRIRFIPFSNPVQDGSVDLSYRVRVREERDGILARWALPALQAMLAKPSYIPSGSKKARQIRTVFKETNDPIDWFVRECLDLQSDNTTLELTYSEMAQAWQAFSDDSGVPVVLGKRVWTVLRQKYPQVHLHRKTVIDRATQQRKFGDRVLQGIALKPDCPTAYPTWLDKRMGKTHDDDD